MGSIFMYIRKWWDRWICVCLLIDILAYYGTNKINRSSRWYRYGKQNYTFLIFREHSRGNICEGVWVYVICITDEALCVGQRNQSINSYGLNFKPGSYYHCTLNKSIDNIYTSRGVAEVEGVRWKTNRVDIESSRAVDRLYNSCITLPITIAALSTN